MLDEKILKILRSNPDGHVSGEEMTRHLNVSRAAIWKHIEKLREEGYEIEASPHLGYRLISVPNALIPAEVKWKLKTKLLAREVISYKKVDSTNDVAYSLAEKGMPEGTIVLAEEQAKGKGRHGRRWESPAKGGIYMSCILRPALAPTEISRITLLAAVAVAKAVREVARAEAMIKWPNDILVNNKKICGILTEMRAEQDRVDFIIVGIGVNVNTPARILPKGASSLNVSRLDLARKIIETFDEEYARLSAKGFKPIIEEWKNMTAMLGARVRVSLASRSFEGTAHDIDEDGSLVVRLDTGALEKVPSGDIMMIR